MLNNVIFMIHYVLLQGQEVLKLVRDGSKIVFVHSVDVTF